MRITKQSLVAGLCADIVSTETDWMLQRVVDELNRISDER